MLGRADVAKQAKTSEAFYAIVNKVFVDYHMAYITEKDRISTAKDAAKLYSAKMTVSVPDEKPSARCQTT